MKKPVLLFWIFAVGIGTSSVYGQKTDVQAA